MTRTEITEGLKECGLTVTAPARAAARGAWNHKLAITVTLVVLAVLVLCCLFIPGGAMNTCRAGLIEAFQATGLFLSNPLYSGLIFGGIGGMGTVAYLAAGYVLRKKEREDNWAEPYRAQVFAALQDGT